MFNDKLLLNHLFSFIIFVFMELVNSVKSEFVMRMLVSSAKRIGFANVAIVFGRSFMYNINNRGPRMDPWGTPYPVGSHLE
jgi:hypothetical protein